MIASLAASLTLAGVHNPVYAEEIPQKGVEVQAQEGERAEKPVDIFLGDEVFCRLESEESYETLVQKLQNHFKREGAELIAMTIEPKLSQKAARGEGETVTVDEAFDRLVKGGRREGVYIAEETESLESIAKKFNMSLEEIKAINPNWEDPVTKGSKIKVFEEAPMIEVSTEEIAISTRAIPFETTVKEDPNRLKSERIVERKGVEGEMQSRTRIETKNGRVVSSVTEENRLSREAVSEIVVVGTKEGYATGHFINPTTGRFTSPFGPRWGGFHYGIDVANSIGTDIKASDGGIVTKAGPAGTYGNLVIIDHQNGTSTRYAHLSRIDVRQGQVVQQGESIAKMGSTGRSTGSHLHFEVRVGGKAQNPLNYVSY